MDSSPDLSLKLRRGSSDSRDSFYMDFAQGIDSDIDEVETIASGGGAIKTASSAQLLGSNNKGGQLTATADDDTDIEKSSPNELPPPPKIPSENA